MINVYNRLYSMNPHARKILDIIHLEPIEFGQFIDVFVLNANKNAGIKVIVIAKVGGRFRDKYEGVFDLMRSHPYFRADYDDWHYNSYTYFEFVGSLKSKCLRPFSQKKVYSLYDLIHRKKEHFSLNRLEPQLNPIHSLKENSCVNVI